jgi:hypothetical protein
VAIFLIRTICQWFVRIKKRLQTAQIKAAVKVNTTILNLNGAWDVTSSDMKAEQTWGIGVKNTSLLKELTYALKDCHTPI